MRQMFFIGMLTFFFSPLSLWALPKGLPIIVDTDMGLDDVRAIYALAGSDQVEIETIVVTAGSASLGKGIDHLIAILETLDRTDLRVIAGEGNNQLAPPPWRSTANTLGGILLPPTRNRAAFETNKTSLFKGIRSEGHRVNYLALGPLSTLSAWLLEDPSIAELIKTLWIPARFNQEDILQAWNLAYDPEATQAVFSRVPHIVIFDLESIGPFAVEKAFGSIQPISSAGRWVQALMNKAAGKRPHLMIYDEWVTAGLMDRNLFEVESGQWRFDRIAGKDIALKQDPKGNISRALFLDPEKTFRLLKEVWEEPKHP